MLTRHLVSLESPDGLVHAEFAHVNELVCGAGSKAGIVLPVHVQRGRLVEDKLLLDLPCGHIPHHGRLVHSPSHYQVPLAVPPQSKYGARVVRQGRLQAALCGPQAGNAIVRPSG